jgi:hypothetical protein
VRKANENLMGGKRCPLNDHALLVCIKAMHAQPVGSYGGVFLAVVIDLFNCQLQRNAVRVVEGSSGCMGNA